MLTSKQIIEQTGISRATLNNYIAMGLLQKPLVQRTQEDHGRSPRIGYFSDDAIDRIRQIQKLKQDGCSMAEICEQLGTRQVGSGTEAKIDDRKSLTVEVGVEDIPGPAYMVNNNFELVWWNDAAVNVIFGDEQTIQSEIGERNLLKLLMESPVFRQMQQWQNILSSHLETAKVRLSRSNLTSIYTSLEHEDSRLLDSMFEEVEPVHQAPMVHYPVTLALDDKEEAPFNLYACFFREGVLFAYAQSEMDTSPLLELLTHRDHVIRNLLKKRKPFLTSLAVMVADLQNSVQICAELPPYEYFELINHIWQAAEPIFRKYYGTHGKHVGDGMVYYFFPQPDSNYIMNAMQCAHELRNMMQEVSREWQSRKNWLHSLCLNVGMDEGQEWFGSYYSGSNLEFTVLGDTVNNAARISDFAQHGSIWATKSMLESLSSKERGRLRYGIRRRTVETEEEILVKDIYSRVSGIVDLSEGRNYKFNDIATLPVTEIIDLNQKTIPGENKNDERD